MYSPKKILHWIYEIAETLKANTERSRVMTLARMGSYFIQIATLSIDALTKLGVRSAKTS